MLTIRIPTLPAGLLSNLVGLCGLVMVAFAVGFITDWRWGLLAGGIEAVSLAVLAQSAPSAQSTDKVTSIRKSA